MSSLDRSATRNASSTLASASSSASNTPAAIAEYVTLTTRARTMGSVPRAMAIDLSRSSRHPRFPRAQRAEPRTEKAAATRCSNNELPSAKSMESWAHRSASAIGPVSILIGSATKASTTVSVGSPIDSTSVMYSEANWEASRTRPCSACTGSMPAMPNARDALSSAAIHNCCSSANRASVVVARTRMP